MPFIYFVATGVGVFVATIIAGVIRTSETRRAMRAQLTLPDHPDQPESEYKQSPAAMVAS
jgi:hypothetical protein